MSKNARFNVSSCMICPIKDSHTRSSWFIDRCEMYETYNESSRNLVVFDVVTHESERARKVHKHVISKSGRVACKFFSNKRLA